jgi:hypothetical protein
LLAASDADASPIPATDLVRLLAAVLASALGVVLHAREVEDDTWFIADNFAVVPGTAEKIRPRREGRVRVAVT